jgi:hemoglobin
MVERSRRRQGVLTRSIALIADAADEAGLPDDPEFRSACVAYLEWANCVAWCGRSKSV